MHTHHHTLFSFSKLIPFPCTGPFTCTGTSPCTCPFTCMQQCHLQGRAHAVRVSRRYGPRRRDWARQKEVADQLPHRGIPRTVIEEEFDWTFDWTLDLTFDWESDDVCDRLIRSYMIHVIILCMYVCMWIFVYGNNKKP